MKVKYSKTVNPIINQFLNKIGKKTNTQLRIETIIVELDKKNSLIIMKIIDL